MANNVIKKGGREVMITMLGITNLNKIEYTAKNNGLRIGVKVNL
ncbi:hypothetical protein HNR33_001204 [Brassicibacter mesophilus]